MMNKLKWILVLTTLLLVGCGKKETLEESVNSRWQATIDNDLEKAYEYFSTGYKEVESLDGFKVRMATAQLNVKWTSGTYQSADCSSEDVCEVKVEVVYSYSFPKKSLGGVSDIKTEVKENWIEVDGQWLFVPKNK